MADLAYADSLVPPDFHVTPTNRDADLSHCILIDSSTQIYKGFSIPTSPPHLVLPPAQEPFQTQSKE